MAKRFTEEKDNEAPEKIKKKAKKPKHEAPKEVVIREASDDEDYYTADEDIADERAQKLKDAIENASAPEGKHLSVKAIVWLSVIIFVLALALLLYLNRDSVSPAKIINWFQTSLTGGSVGDGYPISVTGTEVDTDNFMAADGSAVALSDTALTVTDSLGSTSFTIGHSYNHPAFSYASGKYLVYNMGGTGYMLLSGSDDAVKRNAEDKISSGFISGSGKYALLTQPADYTAELNIYNSRLKEGSGDKLLYTYHFADNYGVAVALNQSGNKGVVATVSSQNGELYTELTILDFSNPEPVASFTSSGNMVSTLTWSSDGTIYAVGDSKTVICTGEKDFTEYDYGGKSLTAVSLSGNKAYVSVSGYENNGPSNLIIFSGAKEPFEIAMDGLIMDISSYSSTVSVLCNNHVYSYDSGSGKAVASAESGYDAKGIAMTDESHSYVLGVSQIRYVALVNEP